MDPKECIKVEDFGFAKKTDFTAEVLRIYLFVKKAFSGYIIQLFYKQRAKESLVA